ncbi:glycine cleavage system protein GcvH [Photobacterium damselae subsp. piscicida]|uniref:Glycine cleavage system H protein n=1 Tax=Photobacterium damsela subsp. piscicida TaxID=38294 RepID=A0A1Q9H317_PHODP|nr:glycine cleavage system protein GcvH [Photobacterium damselae]MBE8128396.1 glycine cleavage system protein GcvH [Photobacterium damselae subsp. piscicida]MCG3846862.1 glycine cleavage system protein GcvH [Photobacterium damselae]MDP2515249.1 glycine cleavage system protein GcvH [Photobacterium damselae subsp. piscicida]MDP2533765.1 glycine cleavage system protein GcvH [Photobacterium damselae subsp. piscicida]MDP2545272.1 glycine cleavage system protein GcvH [Photobacterium damselae subsp. 
MSYVPSDLKFTHSHEWVRDEGNGIYTIGITEHAQSLLGDMVFIDLPELEDELEAGDDCAVVESVKSASDIYAPLTGVVVAINEDLDGAPGLVNSDPYGDGWLFQLQVEDDIELGELLDGEDYLETIADDDD